MLFKNKKIKNNKTLIAILLVIFLQILAFGTTSKAALESNGNTPATKDVGPWLNSIRKMESAGGTLGLSETINDTTLLSTSGSNSLDIHMEKNGEYGIMAILICKCLWKSKSSWRWRNNNWKSNRNKN